MDPVWTKQNSCAFACCNFHLFSKLIIFTYPIFEPLTTNNRADNVGNVTRQNVTQIDRLAFLLVDVACEIGHFATHVLVQSASAAKLAQADGAKQLWRKTTMLAPFRAIDEYKTWVCNYVIPGYYYCFSVWVARRNSCVSSSRTRTFVHKILLLARASCRLMNLCIALVLVRCVCATDFALVLRYRYRYETFIRPSVMHTHTYVWYRTASADWQIISQSDRKICSICHAHEISLSLWLQANVEMRSSFYVPA